MEKHIMEPLNNRDGMVLIMVLFFLITAIVIGVSLMRSTVIESKIVGNERIHNQNFYLSESAAELIIPQFDSLVSGSTWTEGTSVDVSDRMPSGSVVDNADVDMTLHFTGSPPTGTGSSAAKTTAFYYRVKSTVNNSTVEMGLWKAFPKPGT